MTSLYKILKSAKLGAGAAQDFHTAIMAQKMPFAKRSGAEHEYTGAVPVTFTANGRPLLDYLISGNTVQSGTPTPDNPITPQECGNLTAQLFDVSSEQTVGGRVAYDCPLTIGQTYTFTNCSGYVLGFKISIWSSATNSVQILSLQPNESYTFTMAQHPDLPEGVTQYFFIIISSVYGARVNDGDIMVNSGSTALPYEPYGYKIPVSSANTTTPVYLGEVETTRRVKKLVLTGEENWSIVGMENIYGISISQPPLAAYTAQICSHFISGTNWQEVLNNDEKFGISSPQNQLVIHYNAPGSIPNFKTYLQQQYSAGTPVTVWYVLAEPTTGIVNEPLMKIGDYADTVSMEQAGVEIPTARGTNTLDVLTDVKPSEIYIKYKE